MKAISIRQPWAWLIVNGYKDIENRSWPTSIRGEVLVHASKGMTRQEYDDVADMLAWQPGLYEQRIQLPPFEQLERGGIVGKVTITGCIQRAESPWFFGRFGFQLAKASKLSFVSTKGALGFFEVDGEW